MPSVDEVETTVQERDTGSIRISGVTHSYGSGAGRTTALGPVDLTVEPGTFLVLWGLRLRQKHAVALAGRV